MSKQAPEKYRVARDKSQQASLSEMWLGLHGLKQKKPSLIKRLFRKLSEKFTARK